MNCSMLGGMKKNLMQMYATRLPLPETKSSPLNMDFWKMTFLFGKPYFQVLCREMLVSGRVVSFEWISVVSPSNSRALLGVVLLVMLSSAGIDPEDPKGNAYS